MKSSIGRNDRCHCQSGKKYKRCCGLQENPTRTLSKAPKSSDFESIKDSPEVQNLLNHFKRLPKNQLEKIQGLMMQAMSGQDVTSAFEALEKELPIELQQAVAKAQAIQNNTDLQEKNQESTKENFAKRFWRKMTSGSDSKINENT